MKTPIPQSLIVVLIVCLGWLKTAQAVSPPPDGGYPNFTTAEGQNALKDLTTGAGNTALGAFSMFSTTTASFNTAVGAGALDLNTGDQNTAVGVAALLLNTGTNNTGVGVDALGLNTTGESNAAVGAFALYNNIKGIRNTAIGDDALFNNDSSGNGTANFNTAVGAGALFNNINGTQNTAVGGSAGFAITGVSNVAVGFLDTGVGPGITTGNANVVLGTNAGAGIAGGIGNVCIGTGAGSSTNTGNSNVYIGGGENPPGPGFENDTIRIADNSSAAPAAQCFIGGIFGNTTPGVFVYIDADGQLSTTPSSRRFKEDIDPMDNASEALFALKPVSFHYKKDKTNTQQFGLIAEEVAKVNPALIALDKEGKPYSVRYDQVWNMLLNEFLKEHKAFVEEHNKVEKLEAVLRTVNERLAEQDAKIQKVSAQLEVSKAAPQTVLNNQ
jgi:hypothetical protein